MKRILGSLALLCLFAAHATAALNEAIELFVETPAPNATYTGVLFARGWAVAPAGIERVELHVDGEFLLNIPIGESRPDVADIYPPEAYPGSANAGFNIGLFYSRYSNGAHTATVRAFDKNGDFKEVSIGFVVTRFDTSAPNNFIRDLSKIDFSAALVSLNGDTITLVGLIVDGMSYQVDLKWNTTLQGIGITKITGLGPAASTASAAALPEADAVATALNEEIIVTVETPAPNATYTGVLFARGWAVAPAGIERVELRIDGEFLLNIPIGESRPDVAALYPPEAYPGSANAGFNIGLFYSRYSNGAHTATVRAFDKNGDFKEISIGFVVTRFDTSAPNNFIRDLSKIDFSAASVSLNGDTITLAGLLVDGMSYNVDLKWNTTLQGIGIAKITPAGGGGPITPGLWLGRQVPNLMPPLILICFNVSADGTRLTAQGSPCDTEITSGESLGIKITNLDGCEAELETNADIPIVNTTFFVGNTVRVTGTFQSPNFASGTVRVTNNNTAVMCEGSWIATPFSGE